MLPGGKARLLVKGGGTTLGVPDLPLARPVTAQLQAEGGACWSATYYTLVRRNDATTFKANPDAGT